MPDPNPESKELTPEERLFKIIQETEKTGSQDETLVVQSDFLSEAPQKIALDPAFSAGLPPAGETKRVLRLPKVSFSFLSGLRLDRWVSIAALNRVLGATLALTVLYLFVGDRFAGKDARGAFLAKASEVGNAPMDVPPSLFRIPDMDSNLQVISQRNAFQPYRPPAPQEQPAGNQGSGPVAGNLSQAATLRVSGIYLGDQPEALIEATDEKKTYSVAVGSEIRGLKIKEIKNDAVIVTDGQTTQALK